MMVEAFARVVVVALIAEDAVHIFGDQYVKVLCFGGPHELFGSRGG
jgi:hypothetical protein